MSAAGINGIVAADIAAVNSIAAAAVAAIDGVEFAVAAPEDEYWGNVKLLLHMDGSNASTVFTDSSSYRRKVVAGGQAQISTAQSVFGGASALFDGNTDYLEVSAPFAEHGDFTVELALWFPSVPANAKHLITFGYEAADRFLVYLNTSGQLVIDQHGTGAVWTSSALTTSTWYRFMWTRSGSTMYVFLDGTLISSFTKTARVGNGRNINILGKAHPTEAWNGHVDEVRLTSGVARQTASYTIDAAPFPDLGASYPFDGHTTGLWGLYGLSRLLSAYSGPLVRVRRSSDNAEQDVGFLASGGLDVDDLLSFVGANSAYVVTLYDQAGSGRNFTQATAGQQPRIVNAGTYDYALVFDGSNDVMATTANNSAVSQICVGVSCSPRSDSGTHSYIFRLVGSTPIELVRNTGGGGLVAALTDNTDYAFNTYNSDSWVNPHNYAMRGDRTVGSPTAPNCCKLYDVGTVMSPSFNATSGTQPSTFATDGVWMIGAADSAGNWRSAIDLRRFAIYEANLSDSDLQALSGRVA
jgi:hypothetical protein